MAWVYNYFFPPAKPGPARSTDCAQHPAVKTNFISLLDNTEPPDSFKLSEVAQMLSPAELASLGYESWREVIPGLIELAFEMREFDDLEIIVKGRLAPEDATAEEVIGMEGPVRIRRKDKSGRTLHDRKPAATRVRW
jgi:hypothetical protein